jgi:hypothetical protein
VAPLNEQVDPFLEPHMREPYLVLQIVHDISVDHLHECGVLPACELVAYQFMQGVA